MRRRKEKTKRVRTAGAGGGGSISEGNALASITQHYRYNARPKIKTQHKKHTRTQPPSIPVIPTYGKRNHQLLERTNHLSIMPSNRLRGNKRTFKNLGQTAAF